MRILLSAALIWAIAAVSAHAQVAAPAQAAFSTITRTRGACAAAAVGARRADGPVTIRATRQPLASIDQRAGATHDRPGDVFQLLSGEVDRGRGW